MEPTQAQPATTPVSKARRWLMTGVAAALFGIGWVGIFLPGLPTTVFWLGAVLAAGKACPVIERWVYARPGVGPMVRDLAEHGRMTRANKRRALWGMSTAVLLSAALLGVGQLWLPAGIVLLAGVIGFWFITRRIRTAIPGIA